MYRCSQIVNQFVCADFRILTWKFFCFAFGNMAACPNTKKMPRMFASSLDKTVRASEPNLGAQLRSEKTKHR